MAEPGWTVVLLISWSLVWTLVIRVFPSVLGKAFEKRIEHGYDSKLEKLKAELQASYATLQTSVGFLSATQSELRTKVIESTETLWRSVCAVETEFGDIMLIDNVVLPNEADEVLSGQRHNQFIRQIFESYSKLEDWTEKLNRAKGLAKGSERLFVGDRLWIIYSTIIAVHGRFTFLISKSFEKHKYVSWKEDRHMNSLLESRLPATVIDSAKAARFGGLRVAIAHLENDFLKEAARVMSGSHGLADSLSNVQAVLQYQNQQIQQQSLDRERFDLPPLSGKYSEGS